MPLCLAFSPSMVIPFHKKKREREREMWLALVSPRWSTTFSGVRETVTCTQSIAAAQHAQTGSRSEARGKPTGKREPLLPPASASRGLTLVPLLGA